MAAVELERVALDPVHTVLGTATLPTRAIFESRQCKADLVVYDSHGCPLSGYVPVR